MKYEIESLIDTFQKHHIEYEKGILELEEKYGKENPYLNFSISKALQTICEEIKSLKQKGNIMKEMKKEDKKKEMPMKGKMEEKKMPPKKK
jgi:hypothetical protein